MHINTQISRGLERLMARRAGARLAGLGLAGLSSVETFSGLAGVLEESGYVGADDHVRDMRRAHGVMCRRLRDALPVAIDAKRVMEETGGNLSGIFSKIGKALKKVAKTAVRLDPGHMIVKAVSPKLAARLDPLAASAKRKAKTQAQVDAAAAKKAAKAAARQAKADAKAAKKAAKAAAALQAAGATNLDPAAAAAAVLANQSGVNLATPDAQAFAQQLVASGGGSGGGGMIPSESMFDAPPGDGAADGTIFGLSPLVAGGAALALLGGGYLLMRRRKRG